MAENRIKHVQTFSDGMSSVFAREFAKNTTAKYMLNCQMMATAAGQVGIVTNTKGNKVVSTPLPAGQNYTIGWAKTQEQDLFYFFVYNENGYHTIYEFNELNNNIVTVLQSKTDTGGFDVLNFKKDYLILMADVIRDNLLYWVDGINPARKINIKKALDKSLTGYGLNILPEFINAYKLAPTSAPTVAFFSDITKNINKFYGKLRKLAYRFVYDDKEKSHYSDFSNVPLPDRESFTGVNAIPTENNGMDITIQTGSRIVKYIELVMQEFQYATEDNLWVLIATIDKDLLKISDNSLYTYKFYNDNSYPAADQGKVIRPYSFLPPAPLCQAVADRSITYWNFFEGQEYLPIDATVAVTYEDLFIDPGTEDKFNEPSIVVDDLPNSGDFLKYHRFVNNSTYVDLDGTEHGVTASKSANAIKVTIGSDVKAGNKFTGRVFNGVNSFSFSYTATITDSALTVANEIKQQLLNATGGNGGSIIKKSNGNVSPPEHNIYVTENDGLGNYSFSFVMIDYYGNGYYDGTSSVSPVKFNSLKDTGQSVKNTKLGAGLKFGVFYKDADGRREPVATSDFLITSTLSENELGGIKRAVFTITLKSLPPLWAVSYQVARTRDLTYNTFIQMLIQKVIEVPATTTGGEYLDLVIGSLFTYQKIHPNTTLKYEFKAGDRIRFKTKADDSYYPFAETEVLSYKDVTEETINSNLVIDGTTTVTVAEASADNVGRYILFDGHERQIIARTSATQYTINAPIGITGQPDTYLSYKLIDRRGLLRIRKPSVTSGIDLEDNSVVEIFSPSVSSDALGQKQFFSFNKQFEIINPGLPNRYHSANIQNQDATHDAIIKIDEGTVYVRNREMPTSNSVPGAQVEIKTIEDQSYSDFYYSLVNDNGRENVEDNKLGKVHFGSRARFSGITIEDTTVNNLNDFANQDREDFNDQFGDFRLTVSTGNQILAYKELKTLIVPIFQTVIKDETGQNLLGTSTNLLNKQRYYGDDLGIGDNPESHVGNGNQHYHVSLKNGVIVRLGGDGATPISEIYEMDNDVRDLFAKAAKNKAKVFQGFDPYINVLITAIAGYNEKTFDQGFNDALWQVLSDELPDGSFHAIVTPPVHGAVTITDGVANYVPDNDYIGYDSFVYSTLVNGMLENRMVCITYTESPNRARAWRQKESSYVCEVDEFGLRTGKKGWSILEEYFTDDSTLTGEEKPNDSIDGDYVSPIDDPTTCTVQFGNDYKSTDFTRNNCGEGSVGSVVPYVVPANTFVAASKDAANALRDADIAANGQNYANDPANGGTCTLTTVWVWGRIFEENTISDGAGGLFCDYTIRTYRGGSVTPPADLTQPYNCTNGGIGLSFFQTGIPNNYTDSMSNQNSKISKPPGSIEYMGKTIKQTGSGDVLYLTFNGKAQNEWALLETVTI